MSPQGLTLLNFVRDNFFSGLKTRATEKVDFFVF